VHAAVVEGDQLIAGARDPHLVTMWRSCAKPFQVMPLLTSGGFDTLQWGAEELALACASHGGEPEHIAIAQRMLASIGLEEGDLASKKVHSVPADISIREAAGFMTRHRVSSLVLMEGGSAAGIITDRDLREKVVARAGDFSSPVREIMSGPLVTADMQDYCFDALLKMIHHGIHHLVVCEGADLKGIVTNHDFMLLQGTSPLSVVKEIEGQQSIEGLASVMRRQRDVIGLLVKEGARAGNIMRIIGEMNDRVVGKVLQISEKRIGPPPVRYCWVLAGSEGRKEQIFRTDQDNAIIYEDVEEDREEAVRQYLLRLSEAVGEGLGRCGFPPCPAGYVATSPEWRRPLSSWKRLFSQWVNEPSPEGIMHSLVFFDLRPVHGDAGLAEDLWTHLLGAVGGRMLFLGNMANTITRNSPPIGFLKNFLVEKSGEHKDQLNLKVRGIAPLADMVRLFSLERGVRETSTIERIEALRGLHAVVREHADEMVQAFEFLMLLRIHTQLAEIERGSSPDNFIDPQALTNLERKTIREAFSLISKLQDHVIERYRPMII